MPFTFSHPLFAVPMKVAAPRVFSLTGLILGSMSPDFEYFIHLEPYRSIGHTTAGLFLHAIPLSIICALIFHLIIKRPLVAHLPSWMDMDARAKGLTESRDQDSIRRSFSFILSVIIGFWTHIFVDAWTHHTGFFVEIIPTMHAIIVGLPLYKWLQYIFSLSGMAVQASLIVWYLYRVPLSRTAVRRSASQKWSYWTIVALIACITVAMKLFLTASTNTIGIIVVAPISGTLLGIAVASAWSLYRYSAWEGK